jgi:hypothetical protein
MPCCGVVAANAPSACRLFAFAGKRLSGCGCGCVCVHSLILAAKRARARQTESARQREGGMEGEYNIHSILRQFTTRWKESIVATDGRRVLSTQYTTSVY